MDYSTSDTTPHSPKTAANTVPGLVTTPLEGFVMNRLEPLFRQFDPDNPFALMEIAREAYLRGMQDGNLRIGVLL